MNDVDGMKRAEAMAARAPTEYAPLKAAVESRVVRWEWASFARYSFEPAHFEIGKFPRGKLLPGEPDPPTSAFGYGYDAEGRVVVERQQSGFPGMYDETFYFHEPNGIMAVLYKYNTEKDWINVEWFAVHEGRIVAQYSVYAIGGTHTKTYQYNSNGQMVRRDRRVINPPSQIFEDWHELEYDPKGQIVRIHWCFPDGRRILDFERPTRQTSLKARKRDLLQGLTAAILDAIARTDVNEEIYVLVVKYIEPAYEHMLPPLVSLNTVAERERLMRVHGDDGLEAIWNPCEWKWDELDLKLSRELETMCAAANQDIWQNERDERAIDFLFQLAQALNKAQLPVRRADGFVSVVLALERGDFALQVAEQINAHTRKKLRRAGWLAPEKVSDS